MNYSYPLRALLLMVVLGLASLSTALAQAEGIGSKFPVPFGPTNTGREFWFSFPSNWYDANADPKYIRLYITAGTKTQVEVSVEGNTRSVETVPYDIVTVDLTPAEAQPVVRDDRAPVPFDQIYKKKGVHVVAGAPIVVYALNRTKYTTDGFLALPLNGLGREYIVASAADIADGGTQKLPSQYVITAAYDGTAVTIIPPMDSPNHLADQPFTINMDKGDVFSSMSIGPLGDLTGTWIGATKPVSVAAGQSCTYLPNASYGWCDHLVEMLLPVSSWGKIYHAVPFSQRRKGDLFRVFASEGNTKVYINGSLYGTMNSKGGQNGAGWFEYLPPDRGAYEFSADKPIAVYQYNNGQQYDNIPTDPFYLVLSPYEQFQTELVFCTPYLDYPSNFVSIVTDSAGFYDLEIAPGGTTKWEKVSKKYPATLRYFATKINGKTMVGAAIEISGGTYRMRGKSPFAGYIYGYSTADSYGYPLSVAVGDLSIKDTVAPDVTWTQDCDGNVLRALANDYPDPDNERSNLATIEIVEGSENYALDLSKTRLEPGMSRVAYFDLHVIDRTKDAVAYLAVSDMAGNVTLDTIRYSAFKVVVEPTLLAFGNFIVGQNAEKTIAIKNLSSVPVEIKEARLKLRTQGFTLLEPVGPFTLGPAGSPTESVIAKIRFDAVKGGQFADSLGLEDACGFRNMALVTASVGTPIIKVSDMDWEKKFGATLVGTKAPKGSIQVRNASTDGGALIVYPPKAGPTELVFTLPDGMPMREVVLAAGQDTNIVVEFFPTATKPYLDSLVFPSNAPPNPANDSVGLLIGRGIQPGLQVTSKDWGRKRVGTGPHYDTLLLTNTGNAPVRIIGTDSRPGHTSDFGIPDSTNLFVSLDGGATVKLPVFFKPTQIGDREMKIYYHVDKATDVFVSTLTGVGIIPRLAADDADFGAMRVGTPAVERPVRFYIPADADGFTDSVMITGVRFRGTDADFSLIPLDTVITLIPGKRDTLLLTGFFAATTAGNHVTSLVALTPDSLGVSALGTAPDSVSDWKGAGTTDNGEITVTNANRTTCVGDTTYLTVTIGNASPEAVSVGPLTMGGSNDFTLMESTTQFTLAAGTTRDITIRFVPSTLVAQTGTLFVPNNGKTGNLEAKLTGSAVQTTVPASIEMTGNKGATGELSKEVYAAVKIDAPIGAAQVSSYKLTVTYDPKLLIPNLDPVSFRIGSANPNATATYNTAESSKGKIVIDVLSSTPLNLPGELLRVEFKAVFNTELKRTVGAEVLFTGANAACATVTGATGLIQLEPICGLSVRMIEMTSAKYALHQNNPNPGGPVTKINYSLGLDGPTTMVLFNAEGQLVQTLIDEYQQPGAYEVTIDTSNLPSGSYFYKLVSGAWSETRRMDIAK